jgi:hypothetical protein
VVTQSRPSDSVDRVEEFEHYVEHEHEWPKGYREARFYLPLDCPNCGRRRLLYALPEGEPFEGILVHCEKCRAASYQEPEGPVRP